MKAVSYERVQDKLNTSIQPYYILVSLHMVCSFVPFKSRVGPQMANNLYDVHKMFQNEIWVEEPHMHVLYLSICVSYFENISLDVLIYSCIDFDILSILNLECFFLMFVFSLLYVMYF